MKSLPVSRRSARLLAVQILFQRDFNTGPLEDALGDFWAGRPLTPPPTRAFAEELARGVESRRDELDRHIAACADHWDVKRLNAVDRNIMRLAFYEMLFRPDIPPVVSINEAVELAKSFSGLESGHFVNGVLDRAARGLDRPARRAADTTPGETRR